MMFIDLKSGTSVEGEEIKAYRSDIDNAEGYLYLIAGVHGDEVEGIFALQELFKWLKNDNEIEIPTIVIPILNIDGHRVNSRTNAHGVDLNRNLNTNDWTNDFKEKKNFPGTAPLSEPENKFLLKLFEKFPPKFIISMHSWKPLLNFNGSCEHIAQFLQKFNGYEIAGDVGYPTPGSLGQFGANNLSIPVLTYEFPLLSSGKTLKEIWDENKEGLIALLKSDEIKNIIYSSSKN